MNILITGMTSRHTGGNVSKMLTVIEPMKLILTTMGHKVYQHSSTVGQDLSMYDKIFLFLFPVEKMGATRRFGALDVIARYPEKTIISFDDWQYYQFQNMIRSCVQSGRFWNWVDKFPGFITKADLTAILSGGKEVRDRLMQVADALSDNLQLPVCIPKFGWGDNSKIKAMTSDQVFTFDPSLFAIDYVLDNYDLEFNPIVKCRNWVVGSLFAHDTYVKNLKYKWPILRYGHKKTQKVLTEEELCIVYQNHWGIISPCYPTSGDGWWRARFIFGYMFENIILASPTEMNNKCFLPESFNEDMSDKELESVAGFQKGFLDSYFEKKESVIATFDKILKKRG